ncbi:Asp23/Gls24 family envelope stress response protein [Streptomyces sp. NPDC018019]|uniref:Asp23/Gls24 family envelope stress response protein n=1 Tax=Streptomyces sp. NPDC018019 TaxID=3365030 RepID=UPI0037903B47
MTEPISPSTHKPAEPRRPDNAMTPSGRTGPAQLSSPRGKTTIADGVVEKIAGMAAREVPGIHALGGGLARTFGAMRDKVPGGGSNFSRGVKVEVGERQTAIDLDVVVEYGGSIPTIAADVRDNVSSALEQMTGLEVVEINISVNDVHLPDDDTAENTEDRVH